MSSKEMSLSNSFNSELANEDMIDEILENFTLKSRGNAYQIFCSENCKNLTKEEKKNNLTNRILSEKWAKLSKEEKQKYEELKEKEKNRYNYEIETIRHYLFRDYNEAIQSSVTAFRLFENERMMEGFEKNLNPNDIKEEVREEWKKMDIQEKRIYLDRKKENDNFFEKVKKNKKVNGITMYIQKVIEMAQKKDQKEPSLEEISDSWKKLPKEIKNKFKNYAKVINNEREKENDIFELINGVKPKRPAGAYRIFVQEKLLENEIKSFEEGKTLWKKLDDDEKEKYLKKAHRLQLAYQYKKMIYDKKIKKILPKRPGLLFEFYKDLKGKNKDCKNNHLKELKKEFDKLTKEEQEIYKKKYEIAKKKYEEKMKAFKNCVFDLPKKPPSGYKLFTKERTSQLQKENDELNSNELKNIIDEEWNENEDLREKYLSIAEENRKIFINQLREFHKLGYYRKENSDYFGDDDKEDEKEIKSNIKKCSSRNKSSSVNKKKKTKTVSEEKRKDNHSLTTQKGGKSQIKNNK